MQEVAIINNDLETQDRKKEFRIRVLGRLLEHLGVQMYKHRDAAIAELVANAWDAGAKNVWITIPEEADYDQQHSEIILEDDGCGMDEKDLQDKYLVIGRNRRTAENTDEFDGRKVMGRKGIGKLAGFGIATRMKIETWTNDSSIELTLNLELLKNNPVTETKEDIEKKLEGIIRNRKPFNINNNSDTGTKVTLSILKQPTPLNIESLHISLGRRFSRTVQGHMCIYINHTLLKPIQIQLHKNSPSYLENIITEELSNGQKVKYSYSYSTTPIRQKELQGWTILVNGKTAQAPPFFFSVDTVGKSQHSSRYLIGTIEADYLDSGRDDESDIVSTDRQEIDWEKADASHLWDWGSKLTQRLFNEIAERNADESINIVMEEQELQRRIEALDSPLRKQCMTFIGSIGNIKVINDEMPGKEKVIQMADQIIKAFEYRHFVDVIDDIEKACDSPESLDLLLNHLEKWEILESRSILEIIKGRIKVIDKFFDMIVNKAPETANRDLGSDNFHDLIAGFPWLLNPEWQVYLEEKSISNILKEKGTHDFPEAMRKKRIDFLALQGEDKIAVIEIKSIDDVLPLEELRRLEDYKIALSSAYTKKMVAVLIYGGKRSIEENTWKRYNDSEDFIILEWKNIFEKNKNYYEHYRAVLENHISSPNFQLKQVELGNTKKMLNNNSVYRSPSERREGLGPQDLNQKIE